MKTIKNNSFTDKALQFLMEKSKDLFDLSIKILFDPIELARELGLSGRHGYFPSYKKIYNLKNSSYFEVKDNKIYLSQKGRTEIIKRLIKNKRNNKKTNGKWLAIVFDVPEVSRRERNFLRKELKWIGLKELQHSVWITPFDIEQELIALLQLWHKDFKGDIRIMKIDKIIKDDDIKKIFNL